MVNPKRFQLLLLIAVFTIATCGLLYELVAGALASYLLGDSVKQFSYTIGTYMFAMGVGSYLSKFIEKRLLHRFIEIEILIGIIGGISSTILFLLFQHGQYFQQILYFLLGLTGMLVGMEIPLLMRILKDKIEFKHLVANIFTFDYIGALLASLLFPVVLVPKLGLISTSIVFGLMNVLVGLCMIYVFKDELKNTFVLKFKSILSLGVLLMMLYFNQEIINYSERNLYSGSVVYRHTTPYQKIVLTNQGNHFQLYLNNNLQFDTKDEYRYHETLVHPVMSFSPSIEHVLILGGGDGLAAREVLKYKEVKSITLVDLDEGMTRLFASNKQLSHYNQNSLTHEKVKVVNEDAFLWLKNNKQKYDVVIIDFPDPTNYSVGKLYTNYFYEHLQGSLTDKGVASIQTTSPYSAPNAFWCINKTIASIFPEIQAYHVYVPSFGEWGFNLFSKDATQSFKYVKRKLEKLRFYDYKFQSYTDFKKDMLATDDLEINRLDNQVLVRYFEEDWSKMME